MSIHRTEGTNCVVYCPVEGCYIPALEMDQAARREKVLVIQEDAPSFPTQGEAWQYHFQFAQAAVAARHNAVDAEFADALLGLKKKVSSLHVAKVIDGVFNG